jgi:hypothetical protein
MTMQMALIVLSSNNNGRVQVSSQMRMNFNKILLKTTLNYYNNYEKLQRMMKMGNKMKLFSSNGHTIASKILRSTGWIMYGFMRTYQFSTLSC